jgi:hypothetical protein
MTAVRALRTGDRVVGRSEPCADSPRDIVTVLELEDLERSGQIRVTVEFADGSKGEMELYPNKKLRRVVEPGEEPGGTTMVSGNDLWKFVGTNYTDPEGKGEKFTIAGFKRPQRRMAAFGSASNRTPPTACSICSCAPTHASSLKMRNARTGVTDAIARSPRHMRWTGDSGASGVFTPEPYHARRRGAQHPASAARADCTSDRERCAATAAGPP